MMTDEINSLLERWLARGCADKELEAETRKMVDDYAGYKARAANGWNDASRASWWIVMLALGQRETQRAEVGDWAVETSHLMGLRKHSLGFDCAIGKIVSFDPASARYTIMCRDGKLHDWENAYFLKLPKPAEPDPIDPSVEVALVSKNPAAAKPRG